MRYASVQGPDRRHESCKEFIGEAGAGPGSVHRRGSSERRARRSARVIACLLSHRVGCFRARGKVKVVQCSEYLSASVAPHAGMDGEVNNATLIGGSPPIIRFSPH